jgi:hypothetical protein
MRHAVGSKNMRVATGGSNINPVAEGSDSRSASNLEKSSSNVLKRNNGNVRRGFNLCVAPSQDVVSYFGGGESVKAFGRSGRDEGKNVVDNQTEGKYRNRYRMHIYGVLIQCNDVH